MTTYELINYFVALLVVCNPIGALPAMLGLTEDETPEERRKTGLVTTFSVGVILVGVTLAGAPFLEILGIGVAPFRVAGGFVVFLLALSMLNAEKSRIKMTHGESREAIVKEHVGITPLAMPLIAGPGAISTVVIKTGLLRDPLDLTYMVGVALAVTFFMGLILYFAGFLERILGKVGINIFTRIGGLILASNAIESIGHGLTTMFPGLAS